MDEGGARSLMAEAKAQGKILLGFTGLLWVIQVVNAFVFGGSLDRFGVQPRTLAGLWGILFAPFLHVGFAHLIANTVPLLVLGWLVMLRKKRDFFLVSAIAALVGGLGTWLIAPALSVHVGASVLIFGYLGYLLARGIFERRALPIVGSIVTFFLYGGALTGILPGAIGISWQGHLFGLLGGILAARMLRTPRLEGSAPAEARRRIAVGAPARVGALPRAQGEDREAEIEAELAQAKERLKARALR